MIVYIRSFCVSLVLLAPLAGEELKLRFGVGQEVNYEAHLTMQSEWNFARNPVTLVSGQELRGTLSLNNKEELEFPVPMHFVLNDLKFSMREGNTMCLYSLDQPEQNLTLVELKPWRGRPIPFMVIDAFPFIRYSEDFLRKFSGLKTLRYPLLTGLLGEDLHTLFEMAKHPLLIGEGFEILYPPTEGQQFKSNKIFVVRNISPESIQIEVTTMIDRQKITLPDSGQAVISGQSKALWTIDRTNALHFQIDESGTLIQSMRINEVETTLTYTTEKRVITL